ncbi:hypothetical protein AURDEDRAFT_160336 [Auricularia subglabra TFB-10046 SS5]|nr:hypothetical protein AURDEDRAFT_160336 [Auricularia subglabra TFB-10046 SS5]
MEDPVVRASKQPDVYLLFGWMNAHRDHLHKYAAAVHTMYPCCTILAVECSTAFFYSSQRARDAALQPAVNTLLEYAHQGRLSGIIVHCFSNGGGFQLMTLDRILSRTAWPSGVVPPKCGLVFDSCPGNHGLRSALSSMAPRNMLLSVLVAPIVALFYAMFALRTVITRRAPLFSELRSCLLSRDLPAHIATHPAPRLYVYSATDKMVSVREVEAHIALARTAGLPVTVEKYADSPHVAHARTDSARYWDRMGLLWAEACK